MEQTLTIIKPDAVGRHLAGKIIARLEAEGFEFLGMKMVYMSKQDAERFYHVHRERPFFNDLTNFMSSGPCIPIVMQRDNAIDKLRDVMGATNPRRCGGGYDSQGVCPGHRKEQYSRLGFAGVRIDGDLVLF